MGNPLLEMTGLPPFSKIKPECIEPAIDSILTENRAKIDSLLKNRDTYTWDNLLQPLEELDDRLNRAWSPISHMNSVVNSDALRAAYNACLPKLTEYSTELGQHLGIFNAIKSIVDGPEFEKLDLAQKKMLENEMRDFHLSGIDLPEKQKTRFKEIKQALSKLTTKFEENILDATHDWNKHIGDESKLAGLPSSARSMAKQSAQQREKDGWLFTLEFPSYYAVMSYADDRAFREEMYTAYVTRASDQGPNAGKWDNSKIMVDILGLRHELAQLLGYKNYTEYSFTTKMATDPTQVILFLTDLATRSKKMATRELEELSHFAQETDGLDKLQSWDLTYYSEKLKQHKYSISDEDLKPYFPEQRVISGMFNIVNKLYGLTIKECKNIDSWHEDVRFFEVFDADSQLRGQFYLDLYARKDKRGGAWMDGCISRLRLHDKVQIPVAYLTCNLTSPIGTDPALFTHDEVVTLFHEFGHGLHHMLTQIDYASVSGISGVPWDAVELPSQFMENWCWEREALDTMAKHYKTDESLPEDLYNSMKASKNFQSGMQMLRQLEFAIFDLQMHLDYQPEPKSKDNFVQQTLNKVRDQIAVIQPPEFNRFQHGFSHIFAGGYAAGYYSYKWAEVLSADAFSKFEENGIFDRKTGREFLNNVLEQGGSRDPMDLFVAFRGREPTIDALLRHSGIAA